MQPGIGWMIPYWWSTDGPLELEHCDGPDLPLVDLEEDALATPMPRKAGSCVSVQRSWPSWGFNSTDLFLTLLGVGSSRSRCFSAWFLPWSLSLSCRPATSVSRCPHGLSSVHRLSFISFSLLTRPAVILD